MEISKEEAIFANEARRLRAEALASLVALTENRVAVEARELSNRPPNPISWRLESRTIANSTLLDLIRAFLSKNSCRISSE